MRASLLRLAVLMLLPLLACAQASKSPGSGAGGSGPGSGHGFAPTHEKSFTNEQIVFPEGRAGAEKFLQLARRSTNPRVLELHGGRVKYESITGESSVVIQHLGPGGTPTRQSMVYHSDLDHDGTKEYLVIGIREGAKTRNRILAVYDLLKGKLVPRDVSANPVFAKVASGEWQLARPFAVELGADRFLRFVVTESGEIRTFRWNRGRMDDVHF